MSKRKRPERTPEEDRAAFIAAASEHGCDESSEAFEAKLKAIATVKSMTNPEVKKQRKKKS